MYSLRQLAAALAAALVSTAAAASQDDAGDSTPPVPQFTTSDAVVYGAEIATYVETRDSGWIDEVSQGSMTLFDAGGDSVRRTFSRMALEKTEGDKLITKFLSPAEIKGVAALTHENPGSSDDNWLYLPSNKRVRRISGANNTASFQGTEFTYEDLATVDAREYDWRFVEETTLARGDEEVPVFELHARPNYPDTGYSKLIVFVHRSEFRQERIDYFDKAGQLLKTRESNGWVHEHDRFWRANTIEMRNHQTGKRTLLEQSRRFVDLSRYVSRKTGKPRANLTDAQFTTRSIQS